VWQKELKTKNYLKLYYIQKIKNPAPKPQTWKPERGNNSSKTQQYLQKPNTKKQPPTARSLSAVHGALGRIRTCGLLIRRFSLAFERKNIKQ